MNLWDIKTPGFCAPLMLLMASCSNIQPYPDEWTNLDEGTLIGECPMISGIYAEHGQVAERCFDKAQPCHLLSYALLSGGVSYKEVFEGGEYLWPTYSQQVRLNQPNDRTLEISVLDFQGESVRKETLSVDDGDFYCDGEKLVLKSRPLFYSILVSNMVGSISRRFSHSSDGALVLESKTTVIIQDLIFVIPGTVNTWVRWLPVEPEEVLAKRARQEDLEAALKLARNFKDLQYLRQLALAGNVEAATILAERFSEKASLYDLAEKGNMDAAVELAKNYGDHKPLKDLVDGGNRQAAEAFKRVSCQKIYYRADESVGPRESDQSVLVCVGDELYGEETVLISADWDKTYTSPPRRYFKTIPKGLR